MKLKYSLFLGATLLLMVILIWRDTRDATSTSTAALPLKETPPASIPPFKADLEKLRPKSVSPQNRQQIVEQWRRQLAAMSKSEAIEFLRQTLTSGLDEATGLDLRPDGQGGLSGHSSLRVFLLDQLRALDPSQAREIAATILATPTTPDEWAISLAIVATDPSPASRELLRAKARELILRPAWQSEPTAGYLEAFDAVVHNRDTAFVPELSSLLAQTNNRAVAHAAFLTVDRLVQTDPAATLEILLQQSDLARTREATRAGYFARADLRDPAQRAVVEKFLVHPDVTRSEIDRFLGSFPSANFMVSVNLLTRSPTLSGAEIAARDAAALGVVREWIDEPRFAGLRPGLESVRTRLEKFVQARPETRTE